MRFFQKSIARKLFLHLLIAIVLIFLLNYYFVANEEKLLPYYYLAISLGVFLIYFLVIYFLNILNPLKKILFEEQALIAGKPYKRIFTERIDEIGVLSYFFNQVTGGLKKVSFDIKDRERMLDELTIAAQLQRDILPLKTPAVSGLNIMAKNKPASEVGGDSFSFLTVKNKTYIYVGDVTGHGVAAGLIMTMVNSLITIFAETYNNSYEILVNVNKYIKKHVKKAMFMTMVMLCWDHEKKLMTYTGAGHEHVLVYHKGNGACEAIMSGGVALGMVLDNSNLIKEQILNLQEGDLVVLYSDGIIEARNIDGELFGLERLKQSLIEYGPEYGAEGVNYHIAKDVSDFMKDHRQDDDMTLIVMQVDSSASGKKENETSW